MLNIVGNEMAVTLQTRDGYSYGGKVIGTNIEIYSDAYPRVSWGEASITNAFTCHRWSVTLEGVGDLVLTPDMLKMYEARFTSLEWRCDYCGSVQERARLSCAKCGGPRSFIYELMHHSARQWKPVP